MLIDQHVVQVNVYKMLLNEDDNDYLLMVDQVIFLQQKMYNQAINFEKKSNNISFQTTIKFTLFFVNIAGANRLKTSGISSYVSLLITRNSEFCA